jgi:hypothetical protein
MKSTTNKLAVANVRKALQYFDGVSKLKTGEIIVRKGFFYRHGYDSNKMADFVTEKLQVAGIKAVITNKGEIWKPFRGGSTLANSSHWFVTLAEVVDND